MTIRRRYWPKVRTLDKPGAYWFKAAERICRRLLGQRARRIADGDPSKRRLTGPLIDGRVRLVRRFAGFTGAWPWQWTPAQVEAWVASGGAMGGNRSHAGHRSSSLGQRPKAVRHRRQRAGGGPGRRADRAGLGRLVHGQRGGVGAGRDRAGRLHRAGGGGSRRGWRGVLVLTLQLRGWISSDAEAISHAAVSSPAATRNASQAITAAWPGSAVWTVIAMRPGRRRCPAGSPTPAETPARPGWPARRGAARRYPRGRSKRAIRARGVPLWRPSSGDGPAGRSCRAVPPAVTWQHSACVFHRG